VEFSFFCEILASCSEMFSAIYLTNLQEIMAIIYCTCRKVVGYVGYRERVSMNYRLNLKFSPYITLQRSTKCMYVLSVFAFTLVLYPSIYLKHKTNPPHKKKTSP
jgi:hypothetical protein